MFFVCIHFPYALTASYDYVMIRSLKKLHVEKECLFEQGAFLDQHLARSDYVAMWYMLDGGAYL